MMKKQLLLLACIGCLSKCNSQSPELANLSTEQWLQDIRFFMEQAPKTHVDLYNTLSKSQFDSIGQDLMQRAPKLNSSQIAAEMIRWVAAIGDGHTNLRLNQAHAFPVLPFWFKEGFYIVNAQKQGKAWLDWKLLKINDIPVETIVQQLRPYQQHDSEQQIKAQAPGFLVNLEALQAIGVVPQGEKASFTFQEPAGSGIKTVELQAMDMSDVYQNRHGGEFSSGDQSLPLYRRHREKPYWFEWLPESGTLYFQYNAVREDGHESIQDFIQKMAKAVDEHAIQRFVVDLRWNGGGNLFTSKPFTDFIRNNPKINQRGKLFVILGRHTFSAASYFTSTLEFRTQAIFVGEATGARPNHYGDTRAIHLPNSGLEPQLSSIYWQNSFSWDKRAGTQPDLWVEPSATDWLAHRDAAMEAILSAAPPDIPIPGASEALKKHILGRYLFEGETVAEIRELDGKLQLSIEDFIETNLYETSGVAKLTTDVRSMLVSLNSQDQLLLEAMGGSALLPRLPADFMLPKELLAAGKIAAGIQALRTQKIQKSTALSTSETALNRLGYELMKAEKMEAARAVFELNTAFYPEGFNTWDSLAEFYMNTGDNAKAITYYKKSVELNPDNKHGKTMLKKLE